MLKNSVIRLINLERAQHVQLQSGISVGHKSNTAFEANKASRQWSETTGSPVYRDITAESSQETSRVKNRISSKNRMLDRSVQTKEYNR